MAKTRTYNKYQTAFEMHVYDGIKLLLHCLYYPACGYAYPRYHFENFGLNLSELNYEIARFQKFVLRLISNPHMDLDDLDYKINFEL